MTDRETRERCERRGLRRRLLGLVAASALISVAGIAAAATPEVVLNDPALNETRSAASDGYLVWSANSEAKPNRVNSYVMAEGGEPVRLNPEGTRSFGAAIDGTTVVYQQASSDGRDLWFYDVVTEERTLAPDGVNAPGLETRPTLSGDWLLFTRTDKGGRRVVLFDLSTSTQIVLREQSRDSYVISNQVNGDWATFESCRFRRPDFDLVNCQVFRYQISTEELVKIPNRACSSTQVRSRPTARSTSCARATVTTGNVAATRNSSAWTAATER